MMEQILSALARVSGMNSHQIVELHFLLSDEIKKQYKLRANPENLRNAIILCEKSLALSSLVMEAMKRKHRDECDEYAKVIGEISPNSKFYFPRHHAADQLCIILRQQGDLSRIEEIEEKMKREGWGSGRQVELIDLFN